MSITLPGLLAADTATLRAMAARWLKAVGDVDDVVGELGAATGDLPHHWTGADAQAAQVRVTRLRTRIGNTHLIFTLIADAVRTFADEMDQCRRLLHNVVDEARGQGLTIDLAAGTVTAPLGALTAAPAQAGVDAYVAQISEILQRARTADTRARAATERFSLRDEESTPSGLNYFEQIKAQDQDLAANVYSAESQAKWWHYRHPLEKARVIGEYPEVYGAMAGLPSEDRDQANRILLAREKASLLDQQAALSPVTAAPAAPSGDTAVRYEQLQVVNGRLGAIDRLESRLDDPARPKVYLVDYRPGEEADTELSPGGAAADDDWAGFPESR